MGTCPIWPFFSPFSSCKREVKVESSTDFLRSFDSKADFYMKWVVFSELGYFPLHRFKNLYLWMMNSQLITPILFFSRFHVLEQPRKEILVRVVGVEEVKVVPLGERHRKVVVNIGKLPEHLHVILERELSTKAT